MHTTCAHTALAQVLALSSGLLQAGSSFAHSLQDVGVKGCRDAARGEASQMISAAKGVAGFDGATCKEGEGS